MESILDYIHPDYLQLLQERVAAMVGISLILVDTDGNYVTTASNPLGFCRVMKSSEDGREQCNQINAFLCSRALQQRRHVTAICPHTGLTTAATPIFYNNKFLGIWMVGQIRLLDMGAGILVKDDEISRNTDFSRLLESVPTMWKSALNFVLSLISLLASETIALLNRSGIKESKPELLDEISSRTQLIVSTLHTFVNSENTLIYITDYQTGKILLCNDTYAEFTGTTTSDAIGRRCFEMFGRDDFCPQCPQNKLIDRYGNFLPAYTWEFYVEESNRWLRCTNRVAHWIDGRPIQFTTGVEITDRKHLEDAVNRLSYEDQLLKLPNRKRMNEDLKHNGPHNWLIALDIQGLRKINDVYGRSNGDLLLMSVRDYIQGMGIPGGMLYRLDNVNFVILLREGNASVAFPKQVVEQILNRCESPWDLPADEGWHELYLTVNACILPICEGIGEEDELEALHTSVEHTMEIARKTGTVAVYNDLIDRGAYSRSRLELSLKKAVLENMNGFYLVYQPIVDPRLAIWQGIEVLCRWDSAELGPVPPLTFIPVAESIGLIRTLGFWILETALQHVKKWNLDRINGFLLEVNLSPAQLEIPHLDQKILEILQKYEYPPEKLCLEITESNELNFSNNNLIAIELLHKTGVVIALDDFGTGYSSFNSLHKLPAKILKTDRSFINGMESDPFLQRLFYVMVELAHGFDMKIVAEGVETEFQSRFLYKQGADSFQGYLFSKPLKENEMEQQLHRFHEISSELVQMGYARLDPSVLGDLQGYALSPILSKLLNSCLQVLFGTKDRHRSITQIVENIGMGLRVSRMYLLLLQHDDTYSMYSEWCADGVERLTDRMQQADIDLFHPELMQILHTDGLLAVSDISVLDQKLYELYSSQGVVSIVQFPVWADNQLIGCIGLETHSHRRSWSNEEIQFIHVISLLLSFVLSNDWLRGEISYQAQAIQDLFDDTGAIAYVADLETNEILYASACLRESIDGYELTGTSCLKAICGRDIQESALPGALPVHAGSAGTREVYNKGLERYFRIWRIPIVWSERRAYLEYAQDITRFKRQGG